MGDEKYRSADTQEIIRLPGDLNERYEIVRELGKGAYGLVILGRDRKLGREAAIKVLLADRLDQEEPVARFIREAKIMARIRSPFVAEVFDYGVDEQNPFLVTQFVDGTDLKDHLKASGGKLPFAEATRICDEMLQGLDACHGAGVIHRDIKPANVLLDKERHVVLSDFGLGRGEIDHTLTASGTVVGTPAYMSPEQMRGQLADPNLDLYATVLIYCEMLLGKVPMLARTLPDTFFKRQEGLSSKWFDLAPKEASPDLRTLLERSLDPDPEVRPKTIDAFLQEFRFHLGDSRAQPVEVSLPAHRSQAMPSSQLGASMSEEIRRGVPAMGVAAAFLVTAGMGFYLGGGAAPGPMVTVEPGAAVRDARAGESARAWADFRQVIEDVHQMPEVSACLDLTQDHRPEVAKNAWRDARAAFRRRFRDPDLALDMAALDAEYASPQDVSAVSRLGLLERLLGRTAWPDEPPLYSDMRPPGITSLKEQLYQARAVPAIEAPPGSRREWIDAYRPRLDVGGRTWHTLRSYSSLKTPWRNSHKMDINIRFQTPRGARFGNPVKATPSVLIGAIRSSYDPEWADQAKHNIELPVHPLEGKDLVLIVTGDGWTTNDHMVVKIFGRDEDLILMSTFPFVKRNLQEGGQPYQAIAFRVPFRLVPEGPRKMVVKAVGLQATGRPELLAHVTEVYQLASGPPPEVFTGGVEAGVFPEEQP